MGEVVLRLDAVYYHSAKAHLKSAIDNYPPLKEVLDQIYTIDEKLKEIELIYQGTDGLYDKTESFCIQLDSFYGEMRDKYSPIIQDLALVHILNLLCLEAFINIIASQELNPKSMLIEFDKLNIEGKWLFLSKILGKTDTFNKGEEPYQTFTKIVKWRNALVHFKGKDDEWRGYLPPTFFESLGLTIESAEKSCLATTNMIREICEYCNIREPDWLQSQIWSAIETDFRWP
jgi:hypothetical protein